VTSGDESERRCRLYGLDQATWLKNTPFGIHQQFPKPIEDKRRTLYPVLKDAKRQGKNAHTQVFMVQKSCDYRSRPIVVSLPETMKISNLNFVFDS
jgi:hypothetical protein